MKRDETIDTMRGISTFCVLWAHTGIQGQYVVLISPILLPVFFFLSGYLLKIEHISVGEFLKNRLLKLLLPWIVIAYVQAYCNISDIKRMLKDAGVIKEIGLECTRRIVTGRAVWFVPALLVSLTAAYAIIKISRGIVWKYMLISLVVCMVANYILPSIEIWNVSYALINQLFVVVGYYVKCCVEREEKATKWIYHKAWIFVYVAQVLFFAIVFHWQGFDVRNRGVESMAMYLLLSFGGILALEAISHTWSQIPLFHFMGKHSLLYFAFGPHGYIVGEKLLEILHVGKLNGNLYSLIICLGASVAWIVPAMIIDKVCPILNGKWGWK